MTEINRSIGIYRTAFPLYSETFITEQIRSYSFYKPIVICRDLVATSKDFFVITLASKFKRLRKISFTVFGFSRIFENEAALKRLSLIHAHFAPDAVLALSISSRLGIPLVASCHGSDVLVSDRYLFTSFRLTNWRFLLQRKNLMRKASMFIAVSDFLRDAMIRKGYPAAKVFRNYIGVDTSRLIPALSKTALGGADSFVLSIARHTEVKGVDVLIKAFAIVVKKHPTLRLVQIGGGGLTQDLKSLAVELNVDSQIDFIGPQAPSEVLKYLQSCRLLVLSSRKAKSGAEEAFGLVLTEASSCGVPCIGTRVGGIPEAIIDGETGFVVESENTTELADKISLLVSDSNLAAAMGKRGREMVCDMFDIRAQTKKLEALYGRLL